MKISGIYKIQSKIKPERIYIGSGVNIDQRWRRHLSDLHLNRHWSKKLQNHYNKYGKNDLIFSVIVGCSKENLIAYEQFYIDSLNPWFNNLLIANSFLGVKQSAETINKRVRKLIGQKRNKEQINNMKRGQSWRKSLPLSEEHKKKISDAQKRIGNKPPSRLGMPGANKKKVMNILTNKIFDSIGLAAKNINMKYRTFHAQIREENPNKTNFKLI